jgi:hypothetical protein
MHVFAHCCASAKLIIQRRKRMRASRGAAPKRPTEPRRAESWSGVVKLTIRAQTWYASGAVFMQLGKVMRVLVAAQDRSNASRYPSKDATFL